MRMKKKRKERSGQQETETYNVCDPKSCIDADRKIFFLDEALGASHNIAAGYMLELW
jgi:hypothetical protein